MGDYSSGTSVITRVLTSTGERQKNRSEPCERSRTPPEVAGFADGGRGRLSTCLMGAGSGPPLTGRRHNLANHLKEQRHNLSLGITSRKHSPAHTLILAHGAHVGFRTYRNVNNIFMLFQAATWMAVSLAAIRRDTG